MAKIPVYAREQRIPGRSPGAAADPSLAAGVFTPLTVAGERLAAVGVQGIEEDRLEAERKLERQRKLQRASFINSLATEAARSWPQALEELRQTTGEGAKGLTDAFLKRTGADIARLTGGIKDDEETALAARGTLERLRTSFLDDAMRFEAAERAAFHRDKADELTGTLAVEIERDPSKFALLYQEGLAGLQDSALAFPPDLRRDLTRQWRAAAVSSYVTGLVRNGRAEEALAVLGRAPVMPASATLMPGAAAEGAVQEDYYARIKQAESGGRNIANQEGTSSAFGPYQFTAGTWRNVMQRHPELGLTEEGRMDPAQQEKAVRAFTEDNRAALRGTLGRQPMPGELYLAHVFGAEGAARLLNAPGDEPAQAHMTSAAYDANRVFQGKTVAGVVDWARQKMSGVSSEVIQVASADTGTMTDVPATGAPTAPAGVKADGTPARTDLTPFLASLTLDQRRGLESLAQTAITRRDAAFKASVAATREQVRGAVGVLEAGYDPDGLAGLERNLAAIGGAAPPGSEAAAEAQELLAELEIAKRAKAFAGGFALLPPPEQDAVIDGLHRAGPKTPDEVKLLTRLETMAERSRTALREAPLHHAARLGVIGPLEPVNVADPASLQARVRQAAQAEAHFGVPVGPLTRDEVEVLDRTLERVDADGATALLASLSEGLGPRHLPDVLQKIAPKHKAFAVAAGIAPDDPLTARAIIRGERMLKAAPELLPKPEDYQADLSGYFGDALKHAPETQAAMTAAALALYAERANAAGDRSRVYDDDRLRDALDKVAGGVIEWNGSKLLAPVRGMDKAAFGRLLDGLTESDLGGREGLPFTLDGRPVTPEILRTRGAKGYIAPYAIFETVGDGQYLVNVNGLGYAVDYEGQPFVLDLKRLAQDKARQAATPERTAAERAAQAVRPAERQPAVPNVGALNARPLPQGEPAEGNVRIPRRAPGPSRRPEE